MWCQSCREEYEELDAGTCKECYEEASETEEELKREIEDLKSKVGFLRLNSPIENHHLHLSSSSSSADILLHAASDSTDLSSSASAGGGAVVATTPAVPAHRAVLLKWDCTLVWTNLFLTPRKERADLQLDAFRLRQGLFGYTNAKNTCKKRAPADWWITFGDEAPELRNFAVKILSLTCSSSACERNWSTFSQIHTKRRNRLSASRLNSLAYIMYNKKLKDRHIKKKTLTEEEDSLVIDSVPSDSEWVARESDENITGVTYELDDMVEAGEGTHGNERTVGGEETNVREITLGGKGSQKRKRKILQSKTKTKDKGKRLQLANEESEFEDLSSDDEEDDKAIRYDDDSMEDLSSDDDGDDGGESLKFDPFFKPLDTDDTLLA